MLPSKRIVHGRHPTPRFQANREDLTVNSHILPSSGVLGKSPLLLSAPIRKGGARSRRYSQPRPTRSPNSPNDRSTRGEVLRKTTTARQCLAALRSNPQPTAVP